MRGEAVLTNCIFMQRELEIEGRISRENAGKLLEEVWGKEKLNLK